MNQLQNEVKSYLQANLGIAIELQPWGQEKTLSLLLRDSYDFYQCTILDMACLLMAGQSVQVQTPATIEKHMKMVAEKSGREVIYLHESVPTYNRKRLIEYKIPFIIPGRQMYLPLLGIDLREHIARLRSEPVTRFSPSTQVVILHALYNRITEGLTASALAEVLPYSPMTLSRAFDELGSSNLARATARGRERVLQFTLKGRELWDKAKGYMVSPVKKRAIVMPGREDVPGLSAGLTALAGYTMLSAPPHMEYAQSESQWKAWVMAGKCKILDIPEPDKDSVCIEIWRCDPWQFSKQSSSAVDRLSLWLSLNGSVDERVESAMEELLEGVKW